MKLSSKPCNMMERKQRKWKRLILRYRGEVTKREEVRINHSNLSKAMAKSNSMKAFYSTKKTKKIQCN